jgi:hypothetical protein
MRRRPKILDLPLRVVKGQKGSQSAEYPLETSTYSLRAARFGASIIREG